MTLTRRQFLTTAGGAAAVSLSLSRPGAAATTIEEETPEYVTRSYDEALLDTYRPTLVTRDLDVQPELTGYVARSSEHDTTMLVYWAEYPFQEGVAGGYDSHFGDHEPVYVEVDESVGELVGVSYSAYHWLRAWTPSPPLSGESHPQLYVVNPYHHYTQTSEAGDLLDVTHLDDDRLQSWWDNGWDEAIHLRTLTVPWIMTGTTGRSDWWQDTVGAFSFEATLRRTYLSLGFYGAEESDL